MHNEIDYVLFASQNVSFLRIWRPLWWKYVTASTQWLELETSALMIKWWTEMCVCVCEQGYERVRRSSDEEISLMRAHDLEEGTSVDSHSSSSDSQSEEVRWRTHSSHRFISHQSYWCPGFSARSFWYFAQILRYSWTGTSFLLGLTFLLLHFDFERHRVVYETECMR